jgi:hypothetical protein
LITVKSTAIGAADVTSVHQLKYDQRMRGAGNLVWWAFALTHVAACNQIFGLAAPGDDERNTDARDHDAVDLDATADRDGDGVRDGDDLCPDAADPGQFDEDGDGRGDRCDPCPHLDQADDTDGDEDTIPDACDPLPAVSGGRMRWSGFHDGDSIADWRPLGSGTATWIDDSVVLAPILDGEARFVRAEPVDDQLHRTQVIASVELGTPNAGGNARRTAGVISNVEPQAGNALFLCQLETDLPITDVRLADYRIDAIATVIQSTSVGPALPDDPVVLDLDVSADGAQAGMRTATCRLGIGTAVDTLPPTAVAELAPGLAGVRAVGMPVRVRWLVIIDHP